MDQIDLSNIGPEGGMDGQRFDKLTRALATGASRRSVLKGLLGLGGAAAVGSLLGSEVDARRSSSSSTTPPPPACPGQTPCPDSRRCCDTCNAFQNGCCPTGTQPCTTNVTGCCAVCGGSTPVTCGLECCATPDQCCDGECCAAGSACITKAFPNGDQPEERCCPVAQTCDNQCCDGTCFTPLGTSLTGYDRDCCPAEATYCAGTGDFAGQGLCCAGATPDCCVREGEPICINQATQCCLNRDCPDSTDTCERGVCRRSDQTCILRPVCEGDDICCGNDVCGQCCIDTDCPDDGPGFWRCVDLTCLYCPSVEGYCAGRCGEINARPYCGNYDCSSFCPGSCNTCGPGNVCAPKAAGTACDGPCGVCDGFGACGPARDGSDCIGEDGVCCRGSCSECCSDRDCRDFEAGITAAVCVDGSCVCTPAPVTCVPNRDCGMHSDRCGGLTDCGECTQFPGSECFTSTGLNGICTCYSDCTGKQCGNDGCNGSCGTCAPGSTCVNFQCVDACGGTCDASRCEVCVDGACQVFCNAEAGAICCAGDCVFPGPDVCGCGPACDTDACLACTGGACVSRCGTGQTCDGAGVCVGTSCGSNTDCTGGQVCGEGGECCLPTTTGAAKPPEGCPPGTFEFVGACFTPVYCTQNADCCSKVCLLPPGTNLAQTICTGEIG